MQDSYRKLLEQVREGRLSVEQALQKLRALPYEDLGYARVDHRRLLQKGFPEVIYSPGKTLTQIVEIARRLFNTDVPVLVTRAEPPVFEALRREFPGWSITAKHAPWSSGLQRRRRRKAASAWSLPERPICLSLRRPL